MKKVILTLLVSMSLSTCILYAQEVREGVKEFMRKDEGNALYVEIQGQRKNIEEVLEKKFNVQTGVKARARKGVTAFENARYVDISSSQMNYYFDVEKIKGSDNMYLVSLFMKSGNEFVSSTSDPDAMDAAEEILENLQYETSVYEFRLAVDEQQDVVEKMIKTHRGLVEDSIKLEQRLDDLLKEMENNKKNIVQQSEKIDEELRRLEALKEEMDIFVQEEKGSRIGRGGND